MINRSFVAAVAVLVSGSAFAGGGLEPEPTIVERPQPVQEVVPVPVPVPVVVTEVPSVRDQALFLGTFAGVELEDVDSLSDFDSEDYYLKWSPVTTGFSPVAQVIGGEDVWGVGGGVGYGFANLVKPYVSIDGTKFGGDDFNVGGSVGVNVALPVGLALDLGVATPDLDADDRQAFPFLGLGYRW